jgi:hypothetical protein
MCSSLIAEASKVIVIDLIRRPAGREQGTLAITDSKELGHIEIAQSDRSATRAAY